LTIKLRVQQDR